MANGIYTGAGGVRREVTELHTGVGGTKRSVKEGYVGVGGTKRVFYRAFDWGEDNGLGDEKWWTDLRDYLAEGGDSSAFLGMKKRVLLNKAVSGWAVGAKVSMTCIGVNIDADNSATFQTTGCSPDWTSFGSPIWGYSNAKSLCEDFATNCSASSAVKQITKLTYTKNQHMTDFPDEETLCKGFLPSECEMGFSSGYAACFTEWTKGRSGAPYPYYTSTSTRFKRCDPSNGVAESLTATDAYWTRTRVFNNIPYIFSIGADGDADYLRNDLGNRLAPAFVIGV